MVTKMKLKRLNKDIITMYRISGLHCEYITPYNNIMSRKVYDQIVAISFSLTVTERNKFNIKEHIYNERLNNAL